MKNITTKYREKKRERKKPTHFFTVEHLATKKLNANL